MTRWSLACSPEAWSERSLMCPWKVVSSCSSNMSSKPPSQQSHEKWLFENSHSSLPLKANSHTPLNFTQSMKWARMFRFLLTSSLRWCNACSAYPIEWQCSPSQTLKMSKNSPYGSWLTRFYTFSDIVVCWWLVTLSGLWCPPCRNQGGKESRLSHSLQASFSGHTNSSKILW